MLLFSRALCKVQTVNYEWLTLGFEINIEKDSNAFQNDG